MGVLMQAFYWDCPKIEQVEKGWWRRVSTEVAKLAKVGFSALWLPPAGKAANIGGMSMGYDVYDYYDLGTFDQKGSKETWFGSEGDLRALIKTAHDFHIKVYADMVLNHCNGADEQEVNLRDGQKRWTKFNPKSGKFTRDWTCFNPSPYIEDDPGSFGTMPDFCHINPRVSTNMLNLAKWLVEDVGYDGLRYDFVKGFASWIIRAIHDRTYRRNGNVIDVFGVGECWDGDNFIDAWLDSVNNWSTHSVCGFDFPLRYRLKDMCDVYGFSLRNLENGGVLVKDRPLQAVTFVDNHDFRGGDGGDEIVNDKILAYAYILTHEGYPCVFWKDYFRYGLAAPGEPTGIEALVKAHEKYAGGATKNLWVDDVYYAMERTGFGDHPGLVFALNNAGEVQTRRLETQFRGQLRPVAWGDRSANLAATPAQLDADGAAQVSVGPRSYVVLAPT
jgi:alpha-amylase